VATSFSFCCGVVYVAAPHVWRAQIEASWVSVVLVFLACHAVNAFGEYIFHRYVLHARLIPGLSMFYKSHTTHHGLTRVVLRVPRDSTQEKPQTGIVENRYPILVEEQHESSFFPWYSYVVFALLSSLWFTPLQLLFPKLPIFLGGFLALAWTLSLYEILHAIEHWSVEKWKPLLESRRFGGFWKKVYGFHLRHHADIKSNESISGFFGIPIPDLLFGTWVNPISLYEDGSTSSRAQFVSPKPCWFIRQLDALAEWRHKRLRQR
ncbi:MAG TPA: hemolysin III family protein, partial [Candidatus Nanoarchaeia archaeon]|nr:hemolysin III family protein [Candidatus Nanoarchaeia archaeon]